MKALNTHSVKGMQFVWYKSYGIPERSRIEAAITWDILAGMWKVMKGRNIYTELERILSPEECTWCLPGERFQIKAIFKMKDHTTLKPNIWFQSRNALCTEAKRLIFESTCLVKISGLKFTKYCRKTSEYKRQVYLQAPWTGDGCRW